MAILGRERHPANKFPLLVGEAWTSFLADVKANGLRNRELWMSTDGLILDGANRGRACEELGIEPLWRQYEGDDPEGFCRTMNLHRRNMNESIRALVAAAYANRPVGRPKKRAAGGPLPTQAELAEQHDVGESTLKEAKYVLEHGVPELADAIRGEELTVAAAAELAQLPADQQREQLETGRQTRDQLRKKRQAGAGAAKRPPDEILLTTAVRAWEKLGATIETLATNEVLVRYDDLTFELRLQRASSEKGRQSA